MNQISGKVLLKETNIGIPDLLVIVYDIDPGTRPEEIMDGAGIISDGDSLGSVLTDSAGFFKLEYDDAAFRHRKPDELRPDLQLIIRGPEEMGSPGNAKVLHMSKDIRQNAGVNETYIVRIPTATLAEAGITAPTGITLEVEEPEAVKQKLSQAVARRVTIRKEVQKIAAEQVDAERERVARVEQAVETGLLEKLTGVPAHLADRFNYVPPGGDVEAAMFSAVTKTITNTINETTEAKGYLVLTKEQADSFKVNGEYPDSIAPEKIEPYLFGGVHDGQRRTFLVRETPPAAPPPSPGGGNGGGNGAGPNPGVALALTTAPAGGNAAALEGDPVTPEEFVGRLIGTMVSPEEAVAVGVKPRATPNSIGGDVGEFKLHSGPADVPAFYDFHSLQIAFDYVWQKAIDEGVIEYGKALGQQLVDLGGDPVRALQGPGDPIMALRREVQTVQSAHATSRATQMLYRPDNQGQGNTGVTAKLVPFASSDHIPLNGGAELPFASEATLNGPHELLTQLEMMLNERYAFEAFAAGSVNFGILVSYRQRWSPINYQVGDLIKTLTLTPKETRKVSVKRVVKKERNVKEVEDSLRVRKEDSNTTMRVEAEIIAKAESKSNFSMTAKGTFNLGIAEGDSTVVFGKDAAASSSDTKKSYREDVIKAAREYTDNHKLDVETKESYDDEVTETAEISNPNDELPVTYLFYELQRRYKISETIHRLMPVVLVAMDVPNPGRREMDALLLKYGWIINRVLLDDQFRKPLEYLRTRLVGDEIALKTMAQNLVAMRGVVEELKKSYTAARNNSNLYTDLLMAQIRVKANSTEAEDDGGGLLGDLVGAWKKVSVWGLVDEALDKINGGNPQPNDSMSLDAARILEDGARERLDRAIVREKELRTQLDSEASALKAASDAFARAQAEHYNCLMDIGSLRLHVKENILYYMQAIWSHTFKDQLFLSLHKKKVPRLRQKSEEKRYSLAEPTFVPASVPVKAGQVVVEVSSHIRLESGFDPDEDFATLAEVADLDNLLGFKGNYLIFPLKQSNALTDFMMTPYVDSVLGLRDPDETGNFTPEEFAAYARALHDQMVAEGVDPTIVKQADDKMREQLLRLLSAPRRAEDEITVPSGSLYIEALPGAHPILEDFKLMHRAIDVKKVQAEVRRMEIENVRYAARILEGEREDPDVEKKIVVEGAANPVLET